MGFFKVRLAAIRPVRWRCQARVTSAALLVNAPGRRQRILGAVVKPVGGLRPGDGDREAYGGRARPAGDGACPHAALHPPDGIVPRYTLHGR